MLVPPYSPTPLPSVANYITLTVTNVLHYSLFFCNGRILLETPPEAERFDVFLKPSQDPPAFIQGRSAGSHVEVDVQVLPRGRYEGIDSVYKGERLVIRAKLTLQVRPSLFSP